MLFVEDGLKGIVYVSMESIVVFGVLIGGGGVVIVIMFMVGSMVNELVFYEFFWV